MARQRVIASGGTPVPGVAFTSSRATGRQVASTLRRGGVPIRTTSTKEAPPFPQFPRPDAPPREPQFVQPTTISETLTGAEIASILRRGGVPIRTTTTKEAPPFPQFPRPDAPPREPQFVQPATISETLTGKELAQKLRLGGVPVRTVGQETRAPAVDAKSMADPRAGLFSPEPVVTPDGEPVERVDRLTAQQLKNMGVPVTIKISAPETPGDITAPGGISARLAPSADIFGKILGFGKSKRGQARGLQDFTPSTPITTTTYSAQSGQDPNDVAGRTQAAPSADTKYTGWVIDADGPVPTISTGAFRGIPNDRPDWTIKYGGEQLSAFEYVVQALGLTVQEARTRGYKPREEMGDPSRPTKPKKPDMIFLDDIPESEEPFLPGDLVYRGGSENREPGKAILPTPPPSSGVQPDIDIEVTNMGSAELRARAIRFGPNSQEWREYVRRHGTSPTGSGSQLRGSAPSRQGTATASGAASPTIPQIIAKSGGQSGSQAEPVTPPIAVNPPPLPSELQDALDRQAKKRTTDVAEMGRTQEKMRRGIARERDAAIKAGFATKPWADFVRKWKQDPITGENVEDPESYIYSAQGYLI